MKPRLVSDVPQPWPCFLSAGTAGMSRYAQLEMVYNYLPKMMLFICIWQRLRTELERTVTGSGKDQGWPWFGKDHLPEMVL